LGGEITKTPQKATKSVPKKIDLVNQQQPIHQTTPEPSSIQTQTQTQSPTNTHTTPLQIILPEPVAETVVLESVQVTESEPSVTVTVSEPTQQPIQKPTKNPLTTKDQPSSSSSQPIQTLKQTPPNFLKSEILKTEMQQISNELQRLVQLRRSPTLQVAYEEQWATLKNRASELFNSIS